MPQTKRKEGPIAIKIDREQYEGIAALARKFERPITTQIRIIIREWLDGEKA